MGDGAVGSGVQGFVGMVQGNEISLLLVAPRSNELIFNIHNILNKSI